MKRQPLKRLRSMTGATRYLHPHGWVIYPVVRDWDARGYRGGPTAEPKRTWEVKRRWSNAAPHWDHFRTLREARAWCDGHA